MSDQGSGSAGGSGQTIFSEIVAALPLLLFGFGIALASIVREGPWDAVPRWWLLLSVVVGLIATGSIIVGSAISLVRGVPRWGWTWVGAAPIGVALLVRSLLSEAQEAGREIAGSTEALLVLLLLAVGAGLLFAGGDPWLASGRLVQPGCGWNLRAVHLSGDHRRAVLPARFCASGRAARSDLRLDGGCLPAGR